MQKFKASDAVKSGATHIQETLYAARPLITKLSASQEQEAFAAAFVEYPRGQIRRFCSSQAGTVCRISNS
jgi:hypothetical protein